jgi:uncharacterized membrane protein
VQGVTGVGAALLVGALWAAFAGTHLCLSSARARATLIARVGPQPFQGLYSLVAFATFVPLVWIYATHKHAGPLLWTAIGPPPVALVVNHVLMATAMALFVASLLPASTAPSAMLARGPARVHGVLRVTRHPMLMAFALFGVAHLLVNGSLGDVLFFGGFPLFTWIGARHQDGRKRREVAGYDALVAATSIVPFAAILSGRQRLVARELPLPALAGGLILTVVIRWYHHPLFGP